MALYWATHGQRWLRVQTVGLAGGGGWVGACHGTTNKRKENNENFQKCRLGWGGGSCVGTVQAMERKEEKNNSGGDSWWVKDADS